MVLNIFELIKNTILNLWNFTSDGYRDLIWNDREMKVDDKGMLVDHIERISQEILINFIRQQNGKTLKSYSTVIGPGINDTTNKKVNEKYGIGIKPRPNTTGMYSFKGGNKRKEKQEEREDVKNKQLFVS